ncbi:uncharacterized protein LOC143377418 [Andrena cerasifolii]|uniref:uncharacterized protein LOC143377418 n=1 Tax=Andrena cerasifolii TaxID=2819439 RepID=UPI004037A08E
MEVGFFSPRSKSKSRIKCAVRGCESRANKNSNVRFHCFPQPNERFVYKKNVFGNVEKIDRLKAWKIAFKICEITPSMKVCSLHFKKQDYILPDAASKQKNLKKIAIPSCNLPSSSTNEVHIAANKVRIERRIKRRENVEVEMQMIKTEQNIKTEMSMVDENEEGNHILEHVHEVYAEKATDFTVPLFKDAEVQVQNDCINSKFINFIRNDSELNIATGIESFNILNTIVGIIKLVHGTKFEGNNVRMNTLERVVMTYVKLKQNLSYSFLAILFNSYTAEHCERVFHDTVKILSECLKVAIRWPTKEDIAKNLPESFEGFENVRVVLDYIETFIQEPTNLSCQVPTNSRNKETCKIMIGVTPAGNISFISKPYSGIVSDLNIFQQSDLTKLLEPGDAIMVDRGFLIDEICAVNRGKYIKPSLLKDRKQCTKAESIVTSKIARVHIERFNQRINTFQIVGSKMPAALVPLLEDIFTVICATINISSSLLSDQKLV